MNVLIILTCGHIQGNYEVKKLSYLFVQDTAAVSKVNFEMKKSYISCAFVIYIHIQNFYNKYESISN